MSKVKLLIFGITLAVCGIGSYINYPSTPLWAFELVATICIGIAAYKFYRDYSIVAQARLKQQPQVIPPTEITASKGSRRLFVPPPIE